MFVLFAAMLCAVCAASARAHPVLDASAIALVLRDGTVQVSVRHDALAFAMGERSGQADDAKLLALLHGSRDDLQRALADGRDRFEKQLEILVDGMPVVACILSAPTAEQAAAWRDSGQKPVIPVKLEFVARAVLPAGAKRFALRFPEAMGDVVLTVQTPSEEPLAAFVRAGERSDEYAFALDAPRIPGTIPAGPMGSAPADFGPAPPAPPVPGVASTRGALGFVRMGFTHILPNGLDHILFVLGLFFLSPRIRALLIQMMCFTLAHSVTLALGVRGVISLPMVVALKAARGPPAKGATKSWEYVWR